MIMIIRCSSGGHWYQTTHLTGQTSVGTDHRLQYALLDAFPLRLEFASGLEETSDLI